MKNTVLTALALILLASPAGAEEAQFFSQLRDIPLMPGLYELPEDSLSFDKPEGRIVEAAAASETRSAGEIRAFYDSTLPELGWRSAGDNSYVREDEKLILRPESRGKLNILRLSLSPDR